MAYRETPCTPSVRSTWYACQPCTGCRRRQTLFGLVPGMPPSPFIALCAPLKGLLPYGAPGFLPAGPITRTPGRGTFRALAREDISLPPRSMPVLRLRHWPSLSRRQSSVVLSVCLSMDSLQNSILDSLLGAIPPDVTPLNARGTLLRALQFALLFAVARRCRRCYGKAHTLPLLVVQSSTSRPSINIDDFGS